MDQRTVHHNTAVASTTRRTSTQIRALRRHHALPQVSMLLTVCCCCVVPATLLTVCCCCLQPLLQHHLQHIEQPVCRGSICWVCGPAGQHQQAVVARPAGKTGGKKVPAGEKVTCRARQWYGSGVKDELRKARCQVCWRWHGWLSNSKRAATTHSHVLWYVWAQVLYDDRLVKLACCWVRGKKGGKSKKRENWRVGW